LKTLSLITALILAACDTGSSPSADLGAVDMVTTTNPEHLGFVTLSSDATPPRALVNAAFFSDGPAFDCTETKLGACSYFACSSRTLPATTPHAGQISVAGASAPVTLAPTTDGFYDGSTIQQSLWTGAEVLTISATGGEIPAFSETLIAPRRATVSAPSFAASPWVLDRAQPLALAFGGTDSESLVITIGSLDSGFDIAELECTFSTAAGQGTIGADALRLLPPGMGYYEVWTENKKVLAKSTYTVTLRAQSHALQSGAQLIGDADIL